MITEPRPHGEITRIELPVEFVTKIVGSCPDGGSIVGLGAGIANTKKRIEL